MKKIILLLIAITIISCKNETKKESSKKEEIKETKEVKKENFPEELGKVFQTHGGINAWRKAKVLSFNKGEEVHTSDLQSRKIVVNHSKYSLGFDGKEVWLSEDEKGTFKGNPNFYYNLYFYFYAMPFVLSDNGIVYEKVKAISFEGVDFPGYKISYKANIIYYNPTTYQMEWLAYTVTFNSKEPSEKYKLIKYNKWENVNGLILPQEITWFKKDDAGNPTEPTRPATVFTLPLISEAKLADSFYEKPAN